MTSPARNARICIDIDSDCPGRGSRIPYRCEGAPDRGERGRLMSKELASLARVPCCLSVRNEMRLSVSAE
jgi:hypothetical protein